MSNDFFQQSFTPIRQQGSLSSIHDHRNKVNGGHPTKDGPPPPPPPRRPSSSSVPVKPLQPSIPRSQVVTTNAQSNLQNANMTPAVKKTDNGDNTNSFLYNGNVNGYGMGGKVHSTNNNQDTRNINIHSDSSLNRTSWNSVSGSMKRPTGNYYGIAPASANITTTSTTTMSVGNNGGANATHSDADDWFTPVASTSYESGKNVSSDFLSTNGTSVGYHPNSMDMTNNDSTSSATRTMANSSISMQYSQSSLNSHPQRSDSMTELYSGSIMSGPMSASNSNIPTSFTSGTVGVGGNSGGHIMNNFQDEPPLLEELGINLSHIQTKSLAVILPVRYAKSVIDTSIMEDNDMAGPLAFGLLLATELLLAGKIHFGYIYGFGMFGCLSTTLVLNLMSPSDSISVWTVVSILGYSLLPVNFLAAINIFYRIKYMGSIGVILAAVTISWCTISSTRLIERGCGMRDQRYLIGYPNALLYSAFVMLTIF